MMQDRIDALFAVSKVSACVRVRLAGPLDILWLAESLQDALPSAFGADGALVEHEVEIYVEQPCCVLRTLKIPAHPVQTISYA
jgi:hypothetical protein